MNGLILIAVKVTLGIILALFLYRDARGRDFQWQFWVISPLLLLFNFWWLAVFIIPIGYLMFRPKGKMLHCPHCSKSILDELAFCPFCKRSVKRECLKCHYTVAWDATSCPHCRGTALTDT